MYYNIRIGDDFIKNYILSNIFLDVYRQIKSEIKPISKINDVENKQKITNEMENCLKYILEENDKEKRSIEIKKFESYLKNFEQVSDGKPGLAEKITFYSNPFPKLIISNNDEFEEALNQYLIEILGNDNKGDFANHYREIRKYFENILENDYDFTIDVTQNINNYKNKIKVTLKTHPLTRIFINTMCTLYGNNYVLFEDYDSSNKLIDNLNLAVSQHCNSFVIHRFTKCDDESYLSIKIIDIDKFEEILLTYIKEVENSTSFYNIFKGVEFEGISYGNKIKMLFFSTMLNATSLDLLNIEKYFQKYTNFINDTTFDNLKQVQKIGDIFNDELYLKLKRAELEYETPYYLCYMLKNRHVELPNVRLGIETKIDKKVAHILATQSSQIYMDRENESSLQDEIKNSIPKSSMFRFYNPSHLISLVITFGILKGLNIEDVDIVDYMPFRHKKTILEKQMSQEEADIYQTRLTDKNIYTYLKLTTLADGIEILSYPEMNLGLKLKIHENVKFETPFLQELYNYGYNIGLNSRVNDNKLL